MVPITRRTECEPRQPRCSSLLRPSDDKTMSLIESEIVIIDDDGTEEQFDPAVWFE
ncbi:hypothetical protein [Streptomyces sp. NPDC003697]